MAASFRWRLPELRFSEQRPPYKTPSPQLVHNNNHQSPEPYTSKSKLSVALPSPGSPHHWADWSGGAAEGVGRSALSGEREEESVRVLCVARTSLRYVFNTPIQVFNLFGNKRDTFKISMHKTVRITLVECQRHHYILYKTIGGDLIFHLRCIPRDKCANNCAQ